MPVHRRSLFRLLSLSLGVVLAAAAVVTAVVLPRTQSQAAVAFTNPLARDARKYGTPGRPLGMEARIVRADGTPAAPGENAPATHLYESVGMSEDFRNEIWIQS